MVAWMREVDQALGDEALADLPLVVFPRRLAPAFYDIIMDCYARAGLAPKIGQEAIQMQTIVSLVSAGIGISLLPAAVELFQRPHVVYRPLVGPNADLELRLARRRGDDSPLVANFLDAKVRGADSQLQLMLEELPPALTVTSK